jgi:hypothetical protein
MKNSVFTIVLLLVAAEIMAQNVKPGSKIIVNNPAIHQLIAENATIEILSEVLNGLKAHFGCLLKTNLFFPISPKIQFLNGVKKVE